MINFKLLRPNVNGGSVEYWKNSQSEYLIS